MAFDKIADFEEGDLTDFDSEADADGDLNALEAAAHDGSWGARVTFDDANVAYGVLDYATINQTAFSESFWFRFNSITINTGTVYIDVARSFDGAAALQRFVRIQTSDQGTNWFAFLFVRKDDGQQAVTGGISVSGSAWNHISIMGVRSSGSDNGTGYVYVDGVMGPTPLTTVDNDAQDWDNTRFGMVETNATSFGGTFDLDNIYLDPVEKNMPLLSGAITNTGTLTKRTGKVVAGAITNAGTLVRLTLKIVAGAITNTGAVVKQTSKTMAGVITKTGALVRQTNKIVAGVITNTGALVKQINKVVAGSITNTGALKSIRRLVIDFLMDVGIVSDTVLDVALVNEDDPEGRV